MQIKLNVSEHLLTLAGTSMLAGGSENVDTIKVTFDSTWNGFGKLAVFNTEKTDSTNVAIDTDGIATIPSLKSKKYLRIGIVGIMNEQTYTTNMIKVYVEEGAVKSESEAPTDDVYHQILSMFGEMTTTLDSIKNVSNVFKYMGDVYVNGQTSKFYQCGNFVIAEIHVQGTGGKVYIPYPDSIPLPLNSEAIRFNLSDVFNSSGDEKTIGFTVEKGSRTISSVQTLTGIASGVITFLVESTQPAFEPVVTVVTELPTEDIKSDTMYFLKKSDGTFEQYMYVENSWVKIGGVYSDGNGVAY